MCCDKPKIDQNTFAWTNLFKDLNAEEKKYNKVKTIWCVVFVSTTVVEHEIACVDITPQVEGQEKSDVCSIGLWTDISARILRLPSFESLHVEMLGGGACSTYILLST